MVNDPAMAKKLRFLISLSQGNTSLDNVVMNNLRVLKLFDRINDIPLYRGCNSPIITSHKKNESAENVHGNDGMYGF